ncbi:hypothetical protein GCM10019059_14850 [Camelimonas fluminis]|uniref:Uncharacterized protein n=1 Tax=Camelimonas fluminis TaxID=1576911 RepID=A0ABV7ULM4_9HYPH|nr:hypothetical protein [Camelimonas fluminis]GHE56564.1 hypothetical protein GCM10019059_14850 [Camelimonas fluminis]
MSIQDIATSTQLTDDEYLPIWTALMETARGRSFLREFARRTRSAETRTLLDAVQKLEHALLDARQEAPAAPARTPGGETARLQAAIAQAVPALEYAARIGARARADLQSSVDDIQAASNALRPLIDSQMDDHAAASARHVCDSIDARVLDMDEIIAVQQLGDEQAINATAALAELVTAAPQPGAAMAGAAVAGAAVAGAAMADEPAQPRPASRAAAPRVSTAQGSAAQVNTARTHRPTAAPASPKPAAAPRPQPVRHAPPPHEPAAAQPGHAEHPAVQKLIQEITSRLLNGQDIAPSAPSRARR